MKAKIRRVAEGISLVVDEPLLAELGLDDGTEVELSRDGGSLVVTPIRDARRERRFRDSAEKVTEKYAGLFRRLSK